MECQPIFIEDVLTISKEQLGDIVNYEISNYNKNLEIHGRIVDYSTKLSKSNDDIDNLSVSMHFVRPFYIPKFDASVTFIVKSANHSVNGKQRSCIGFTSANSTILGMKICGDLCTLADVLNPEKNFIENGKLTIHAKALIIEKDYCNNYSGLGIYLWKRDDRDFIIAVGKDGEAKTEIKIHKLVLASRSPVFDRMLETDMKEKAESKLDIIDFDPKVVQAAVEYCYDQDELNSADFDTLTDLLRFAEKYDIQDLKSKAEYHILSFLNPDTICRISNASIIFNSPSLKRACIECMELYNKHGIQLSNAETLDEDIKKELEKISSTSDDDESD